MTDPTSDRDDDLLRDALRAEAGGVTADDDLLERIRAEATAPAAPARRSRLPVLLVAAAVLTVLALAAALLTGTGDDERVDLVDTPDPTAPTETTEPDQPEPGDDPSASAPTTEADGPVDPGPRPDVIVGVTEDGRLVVVDVDTGEELRELWALDDPRGPLDEETGMGPWHISGVALHPDGQRVFVETCCEPAGGSIYTVALDGSMGQPTSPTHVGYGMDVSADGRWLASMSSNYLILSELDRPGQARSFDLGDEAFHYSRVAVNEDGTEVTVEHVLERDEAFRPLRSEGVVLRIDGDAITEINRFRGEGVRRAYAVYGRAGWPGVSGTAPEGTLSVRGDASGVWLLEVSRQLGVTWMSVPNPPGQGRGPIPGEGRGQIPTDLRFVAADW